MPVRSRKPVTIHQQFLFALIGVNMLVMLVASVTFYVEQKQSLLSGIDAKLTSVATMARETLPPDYHDRIAGHDSVTEAEFHEIVNRNNRLCVELGIEYIWSLMVIDGKIVFTTSTSPDKRVDNHKHAEFFEAHSNPELYTNTFATMQAAYKSNHDKWGDIRVALLPSVDHHGRKYLFGASVRLTEVNRQLRAIVWQSVAVGLAVFVFSMAVGIWVSRVVTDPLRRLAETIQAIAAGKSGVEADERGSYEQVTLASHFNRLNRALQEKISELEASHVHLIDQRDTERRRAEEDMIMSERRYCGLLNFAVDGILVGSHEGVIIEANEYICTLFGKSREDLLGKHVCDMPFTPESVLASPFRFDVLQRGETVVSERTIRRPDASEVVVEMRTKMMFDGTYQSIYRDITERKCAEEKLRQSQKEAARQYEMLTALLQSLDVGVFMVDASSARPLVANQTACQLLGWERPPDRDLNALIKTFAFYRASDRTPWPIEMLPILAGLRGERSQVDDILVIRPDGVELLLEVFGMPVKDEQGRIWAGLTSFIDISARKRVERALRESEDRYHQLFEMESDAILLVENETSRILDANLAAQSLYGYSRDELLSMSNVELSAEPVETRQVSLNGMKAPTPIVKVPLRHHRKKDGTVFPVEITGRFFLMNGRSVHIAAIRDITERKKAQEFLESWNATLERRVTERTEEVKKYSRQLQALTGRLVRVEEDERQRISDVLHEDLQQVLVAARMTLGIAVESIPNAETLETLTRVDDMLTRSLRLARSLVQEIAVPALREGDLPFAVGWIAEQMLEKFGLQVVLACEENMEPLGQNVYVCLYRVVQELLFNVVKHAGVKHAEVEIQRQKGNLVRITVSDKGRGFSVAALSETGKGSDGFGLFSIRERVEGLCGRMEIASIVGQGTTVTLTVPMCDVS